MWGLCGAEIAAARVVSRCVRALVSRGLHLLDSGVADAVVARRLSILELLELPEPMLLGRMATSGTDCLFLCVFFFTWCSSRHVLSDSLLLGLLHYLAKLGRQALLAWSQFGGLRRSLLDK